MSATTEELIIQIKATVEGLKQGIAAAEKEIAKFRKYAHEQLDQINIYDLGAENAKLTLEEVRIKIKENTKESKELEKVYNALSSAMNITFMGALSAIYKGVEAYVVYENAIVDVRNAVMDTTSEIVDAEKAYDNLSNTQGKAAMSADELRESIAASMTQIKDNATSLRMSQKELTDGVEKETSSLSGLSNMLTIVSDIIIPFAEIAMKMKKGFDGAAAAGEVTSSVISGVGTAAKGASTVLAGVGTSATTAGTAIANAATAASQFGPYALAGLGAAIAVYSALRAAAEEVKYSQAGLNAEALQFNNVMGEGAINDSVADLTAYRDKLLLVKDAIVTAQEEIILKPA